MIIKSHIRGSTRAASAYLKAQGKNERTRLVEITDKDATCLDEAFQNMWAVASSTRVQKTLHHISINPFKDERLTDEQLHKIVRRCEEKYGYDQGEHQRVIVEHIKEGRQHFHVIWNRVRLSDGHPVWPGHHWRKSKQAAREMEQELGLKRPTPRRAQNAMKRETSRDKPFFILTPAFRRTAQTLCRAPIDKPRRTSFTSRLPLGALAAARAANQDMIAWAFAHHRADILAQYGIFVIFRL